MAFRRLLGCLPVALAVCSWAACKDKAADKGVDKAAVAKVPATAADLDTRCEQLGKVCGDKDKHVERIIAECKTANKQVANRCMDQAIALYDCYENQLCPSHPKVWALVDLGVLADRESTCVAERTAATKCTEQQNGSAR